MSKTIEIKVVCPLLGGKQCIADGVTRDVLWNNGTAHACMFYDVYPYFGVDPEEPCKLKRAVNRILSDEEEDRNTVYPVEVPWDVKKGVKDNGQTSEG